MISSDVEDEHCCHQIDITMCYFSQSITLILKLILFKCLSIHSSSGLIKFYFHRNGTLLI